MTDDKTRRASTGKKNAESLKKAMQALQEAAEALNSSGGAINETSVQIVARRMKEIQFDISKITEAIARANAFVELPGDADAEALDRFYNELDGLEPFIDAILDGDPDCKGMKTEQLLESVPLWAVYYIDSTESAEDRAEDEKEAGNIKTFIETIHAAREARAAEETEKAAAEAGPYRPVKIQSTDKTEYPLDKINNQVWKWLQEAEDGQLSFTFDMAKRGSKDNLPVLYSINFEGLQDIPITKRLTLFDKRVYIAISNLYNSGNEHITPAQIYKHMGYNSKGGGTDGGKLRDSILKMMKSILTIDDDIETKKYPKRLSAKYTGILLPVEIGELYDIRGSLTEAGIHVLREPPLMTFAKRRGQVTTISLKLLQSPVSKTEANLKIDDYLIEHISRAKRGTRHSCRMLYKTIYEKANINNNPKTSTEKQQKKRAPEKINKYLTHYQKEGFITRFTADADGITVYW